MKIALVHLGQQFRLVGSWLVRSSEFTNYSYPLTALCRDQLASFVATVTSTEKAEILGYFNEIENDQDLMTYFASRDANSRRSHEYRSGLYLGRRIGWYAIVRAKKPKVLIETGTDKGLGSVVLAQAIRRNGAGHLYTIDVEAESGYLIGPEYDDVVTRILGDSLETLRGIRNVDWMIHDSDHARSHELNEFIAVEANLSPGAMVLTDNAHGTDALSEWSMRHGRNFLFFQEQPESHWYRGAGIGVSWISTNR